jgi:hypothetical protein
MPTHQNKINGIPSSSIELRDSSRGPEEITADPQEKR